MLLLSVLLPTRVVAVRTSLEAAELSHASVQRLPETVAQKCIYHHDLELACGAGRAIDIISAFWNRRELKDCKKTEHVKKDQQQKGVDTHCHANGTDQVAAACNGHERCTLPQGFTGCIVNPFTWIRVRYVCPPATALLEPANAPLKEVTQLHEEEGTDEKNPGGAVTEVMPLNLTSAHCNLLTVQTGAFNCDKKTKVGGHTSSPVLTGDNQCRCSFIGVEPMTCSRLFAAPEQTVYHAKYTHSKDAVFGTEGCDCYPTGDAMWSLCDLAVREELV